MLGGFSAFQQVVSEPPHERRTRLPLEWFVVRGRARSETVEAEMLTSEGLKGPKRAEMLLGCLFSGELALLINETVEPGYAGIAFGRAARVYVPV
jgi:hypothetical protein